MNIHVYTFCFKFLIFANILTLFTNGNEIYVDKGNPYSPGPLSTGSLVITKNKDKSPLHTTAYYPTAAGDYPVVFFVGGFYGDVPAEFFYATFLDNIAKHGFIAFAPDHLVGQTRSLGLSRKNLGDVKPFEEDIQFLKQFMQNKTVGTPRWDKLALACHSAGCDDILKMLIENPKMYTAAVFMEPFSFSVSKPLNVSVPALMYGTQFSEEGFPRCCIAGTDYRQFYKVWQCPKIVLEVADFGHCDILDAAMWTFCHDNHVCKTTNDTSRLDAYHQFTQGVAASALVTYLQGRPDALDYVADQSKMPPQFKLLLHQTDLNCTKRN